MSMSGLTEGPPPLSIQPVSFDQGPPGVAVCRSVPPTATIFLASSGQGPLASRVESSPLAVRLVCPCAANSANRPVSVLCSLQPQEVLSTLLMLSLAMALSTSSAVLPTYTRTLLNPGAIEIVYSMSSACSPSLHLPVQVTGSESVG